MSAGAPLLLALALAAAPVAGPVTGTKPFAPAGEGRVAPADTTLPARRGDRLVVENFSGRVVVGVGGDDVVQLAGDGGDRVDLRLERRGARISVEPPSRRPGDREMDAVLRVPSWMDVTVRGRDLDVEVREVAGRVEIQNVEGDILLTGTRGSVDASTVDGVIRAVGARGDLSLRSQGDDVEVEDFVAGTLEAESGDGDITLRDVDAVNVAAETLDGDVLLDGLIRSGGRYRLSTHDGDADVRIPREAGLRVSVSTFDGEFVSDFPVTVERFTAGRTFEFTLGDGSARLEIQVFDGEIRLGERR